MYHQYFKFLVASLVLVCLWGQGLPAQHHIVSWRVDFGLGDPTEDYAHCMVETAPGNAQEFNLDIQSFDNDTQEYFTLRTISVNRSPLYYRYASFDDPILEVDGLRDGNGSKFFFKVKDEFGFFRYRNVKLNPGKSCRIMTVESYDVGNWRYFKNLKYRFNITDIQDLFVYFAVYGKATDGALVPITYQEIDSGRATNAQEFYIGQNAFNPEDHKLEGGDVVGYHIPGNLPFHGVRLEIWWGNPYSGGIREAVSPFWGTDGPLNTAASQGMNNDP